jgi:hypothetical protein
MPEQIERLFADLSARFMSGATGALLIDHGVNHGSHPDLRPMPMYVLPFKLSHGETSGMRQDLTVLSERTTGVVFRQPFACRSASPKVERTRERSATPTPQLSLRHTPHLRLGSEGGRPGQGTQSSWDGVQPERLPRRSRRSRPRPGANAGSATDGPNEQSGVFDPERADLRRRPA